MDNSVVSHLTELAIKPKRDTRMVLFNQLWDLASKDSVDPTTLKSASYFDLARLKPYFSYDCHLILRASSRLLFNAYDLLALWGFTFIQRLETHWPIYETEDYLKGRVVTTQHFAKFPPPVIHSKTHDVNCISEKIRSIGCSTTNLYTFMESVSDGPYLELFQKDRRENWTGIFDGRTKIERR